MDGLRKNKTYLFLFWLFIVVSIVHVFYAAFVNRGMYYDGTFYMLLRLDLFSRGIYNIIFDPEHPRLWHQIQISTFTCKHPMVIIKLSVLKGIPCRIPPVIKRF